MPFDFLPIIFYTVIEYLFFTIFIINQMLYNIVSLLRRRSKDCRTNFMEVSQ